MNTIVRHSLRPALALCAALLFAGSTPEAHAAPSNVAEQKIDLELREADLRNVLALLGQVGGVKTVLDPCVQGKVDIRLKNTPVPVVLDVIGRKFSLVYEEQGSDLIVRCANVEGDAAIKNAPRVTLSEKDAELPGVLGRLAASAKLDSVDYRAARKPRVNVTLEDVRLSTAVTALADETGLKLAVSGRRLVVTE
jgi:type II secretory pathway component HofQ